MISIQFKQLMNQNWYNLVTLWGSLESQVTPSCPHKLFTKFQYKSPTSVNDL